MFRIVYHACQSTALHSFIKFIARFISSLFVVDGCHLGQNLFPLLRFPACQTLHHRVGHVKGGQLQLIRISRVYDNNPLVIRIRILESDG